MSDETLERKAVAVLEHLDVESRGRLLALNDEERDAVHQELFEAARAAWPADEPEPEHPGTLVERVVEGRRELAWAAALYALLHDRQVGEDPPVRYERAMYRWKLGHVLFLLDERGKDNIRRCLSLAEETLRQAETLWRGEGISHDAFFSLIFELQSWMGFRYEALGLYELAERAYSEASLASRNTNDKVAYTTRMASVMEKLGKKQTAYELLLLVRDQLEEVDDEVVRWLWETAFASLQFDLGGEMKDRGRRFGLGVLEGCSDISQIMIEQGPSGVEQSEKLGQVVEEYRRWSEELPEDNPALSYTRRIRVAYYLLSVGRNAEADELLREAEALEDSFEDEVPKLERRILIARRQKDFLHDFSGAQKLFLDLLPDAERLLEGDSKLVLYGYVLESLIADEDEPACCSMILDLTAKGCALFEEILDQQPGSGARRRMRETHQRFFESAMMALVSAAQQVGDEPDAEQKLLERAWNMATAARNPELRAALPTPCADELRHLRKLEDAFHRVLRDRLVLGTGDWSSALEELHEQEMAILRAFRAPSQSSPPPSGSLEGPAVMFFLVRDLLGQPVLFVLGRRKGRYDAHAVPETDALLDPLAAWNERFSESAAAPRREVDEENTPAPRGVGGAAPVGIKNLLPLSYSLLPSRTWSIGERDRRDPLFPDPWFLFPDGALNAVPLEMLPDSEETRFGQGRAVHLCLRSSVIPACGERVDFSQGWLGLGGVPKAGSLEYLPGSLEEVTRLEGFLREQGHPTRILTGPEATGTRLREELDRLKPAVLHIAVHGSAGENPDACALILADDPEGPERELLPFRRIRDLDLSKTHLVVLSACKSLIGRSGRDAGMQGLAWAFLQAGAAQVIASRYTVRDEEAVLFMDSLYRHLQVHTAGEALGHARDECLRSGMDPREVAAWSVWS